MDTTLQRLTDLEGSVARLQDGLASVESDIKAEFDTNPVKIISNTFEPNVRKTVLNITGKGELYLAGVLMNGSWQKFSLIVEIDGKTATLISKCSSYIATRNRFYHDKNSGSITAFSDTGSPDSRANYVSVNFSNLYEAEKELFSEDNITYYFSATYGYSQTIGRKKLYRFNSSLKVILDSTLAENGETKSSFDIVYSLDPT